MNGVDQADQLRASYPTQLKALSNWLPLFFWILDTSIVNSFLLYRFTYPNEKHRQFCLNVVTGLFNDSQPKKLVKPRIQTTYRKRTSTQYFTKYHHELPPLPPSPHELIHLPAGKQDRCIFCRFSAKNKILPDPIYLFFLFCGPLRVYLL